MVYFGAVTMEHELGAIVSELVVFYFAATTSPCLYLSLGAVVVTAGYYACSCELPACLSSEFVY